MANQIESGTDRELIQAKLNSETAKIAWIDLQSFFAAGQTLFVTSELDLIDVALTFQQDDVEQLQTWLQQNLVSPVSDNQARDWFEQNRFLWSVVVKPWLLVQLPPSSENLNYR